jgi:hypothetical protein
MSPKARVLKAWSLACGLLGRWWNLKRWGLVGSSWHASEVDIGTPHLFSLGFLAAMR